MNFDQCFYRACCFVLLLHINLKLWDDSDVVSAAPAAAPAAAAAAAAIAAAVTAAAAAAAIAAAATAAAAAVPWFLLLLVYLPAILQSGWDLCGTRWSDENFGRRTINYITQGRRLVRDAGMQANRKRNFDSNTCTGSWFVMSITRDRHRW